MVESHVCFPRLTLMKPLLLGPATEMALFNLPGSPSVLNLPEPLMPSESDSLFLNASCRAGANSMMEFEEWTEQNLTSFISSVPRADLIKQ